MTISMVVATAMGCMFARRWVRRRSAASVRRRLCPARRFFAACDGAQPTQFAQLVRCLHRGRARARVASTIGSRICSRRARTLASRQRSVYSPRRRDGARPRSCFFVLTCCPPKICAHRTSCPGASSPPHVFLAASLTRSAHPQALPGLNRRAVHAQKVRQERVEQFEVSPGHLGGEKLQSVFELLRLRVRHRRRVPRSTREFRHRARSDLARRCSSTSAYGRRPSRRLIRRSSSDSDLNLDLAFRLPDLPSASARSPPPPPPLSRDESDAGTCPPRHHRSRRM